MNSSALPNSGTQTSLLYCHQPSGDVIMFAGSGNNIWRYSVTSFSWSRIRTGEPSSAPTYGTQNQFDPLNSPGSRVDAMAWEDPIDFDKLWLFGGVSGPITTFKNDLWQYSISLGQWSWIGGSTGSTTQPFIAAAAGSYSPSNWPGSTHAGRVALDRTNNRAWIFGGRQNFSTGCASIHYLNFSLLSRLTRFVPYMLLFLDSTYLWTFDMSLRQWSYQFGAAADGQFSNPSFRSDGRSDPGNTPGTPFKPAVFTDETDFYVFGSGSSGFGGNNMFAFHTSNRTWSWLSGQYWSNSNNLAVYGTKNIAHRDNIPGGRSGAVGFYDYQTRSFLVYSGNGFSATESSRRTISNRRVVFGLILTN